MSRKSAHNDPVLHASEFCQAFLTWANACTTPLETDSTERREWRQEFAEHWKFMELAIYKSCLLDRLIYCREELRTKTCPIHKGTWSGYSLGHPPCECAHDLGHNHCHTGWLPEESGGGAEADPYRLLVVTR
jgi:hypothetical protein